MENGEWYDSTILYRLLAVMVDVVVIVIDRRFVLETIVVLVDQEIFRRPKFDISKFLL